MTGALFPDVVVNGEAVPHAAIASEVQNHDAPAGKPGIAWRKAANAMAIRTLMLQEARRRALSPDPQEIGPGRIETEEEALVRNLLETAVIVETPSDNEVEAEWSRDPTRFRAPPLWEVSHILCACGPRDPSAREAARLRAVELAARAGRAPARFAALASEHSDCGSRASDGALGQLGLGDTVPEFEEVLRSLADGEITAEPVLTRHGWHVIRLDAVAEGAVLPFTSVRHKIADAMEKAMWIHEARRFVDGLVTAAEISGADMRPV